ncbi:transcriptional regulator, AraC family [Methylophaga frappieri]|uniref:Transcriptional regulator, AraC family n=1 Tax=Methylophaga frappieri (strain ATCC BAA-2434 / DSM 25690 / JAM7) TaxID=754477 RepID=I1YGW5_METFJ|nr:helix-turn-helix domain-containing protein [Methylophaga frappieri]AFJ02158.1 transcriptional regulator, AraC family [Methylophaga frappieri]
MTNAQRADLPSYQQSLIQLDGQRLCTKYLPEKQRVAWLKEVIGREYANVDIQAPKEMPLFNDMYLFPWQRGMRLSPIHSNALSIQRLAQEPDNAEQDCYFIVMPTKGEYKLEQDGKEVFLKPGEMTLYDATRPHRIEMPTAFSKLLISIPRYTLEGLVRGVSRLTATNLSKRTNMANVTLAMLAGMLKQMNQFKAQDFQSLAEPALQLITMTLNQANGIDSKLSRHRELALHRVKNYIAHNIDESNLTARQVANSVGLSVRYINNLFTEEQTSLMRYLTQQRLMLSHQILSSHLYNHFSITEVAMRCGFNSLAHFSRVFHEMYGLSPRELRKQRK